MPGVLVDTDLLVQALRGGEGAVARIDAVAHSGPRHVSVLTIAELRAGRSGDDPAVDAMLESFRVLALGRSAAERGGRLRRMYAPTHGTGLVDAILAATAIEGSLVLITNNGRHYPMPELTLA
jgi:predicted nucleic acid-binding protein